jgi:NTP pyrophosphatase (non-canonical NTP hydrolase)
VDLNSFVRQARDDSRRWFPSFGDGKTTRLVHYSLGMAGETGEFCNLVKKVDRGDLNLGDANVKYNLTCELTDVLTYLCCIAGELGIDLEKSMAHIRANNEKRFGKDKK